MIVAVKGIGGFHLACDATSAEAVRRLRPRKNREEKPFAVMVRDLRGGGGARRPLAGRARAARRRSSGRSCWRAGVPSRGLAPEIAPGNPLIGLLLPYTPLHHLLLADGGRPLVMTSGNLSDEPIATRNAEALEAARVGIADVFLVHDREIALALRRLGRRA